MFLAHGWTRIFSLNTNRSNITNVFVTRIIIFVSHRYSQMDTDLPCGWNNPMVRRKKIRLIRAIRVQKINGPEEKI